MPKALDISSFLDAAKQQLHEEADYLLEGARLTRYRALLADRPAFLLPQMRAELTTPGILAMSRVEGVAIESLQDAPQPERDRLVGLLFELLFREIFEFRLVQTDPNFANYLYEVATGRLILLAARLKARVDVRALFAPHAGSRAPGE